MNDYVYGRVYPTSNIQVIGHTDIIGLYETNKKLSERRAGTVYDGINKVSKRKYGNLDRSGVGEDNPLYNNDLPEGRFYNRTVQVLIQTPLSEFDNK
jgi:OOP family OmpA-OmpF porin